MEKAGWVFENIETGIYDERCKGDAWHGYRNTPDRVSGVSATFQSHGLAELKVGNCGFDIDAKVKLYLNGKELESIDKMAEKYISFRFSPNDTLYITPTSEFPKAAIINLFYVKISCGKNNAITYKSS